MLQALVVKMFLMKPFLTKMLPVKMLSVWLALPLPESSSGVPVFSKPIHEVVNILGVPSTTIKPG